MCTVTYIPTGSDQCFIFTSNRDEYPYRNANELISKQINNKKVLYPRDEGAKGTWIAISDSDQLVCILNGAFTAHTRRNDYVKSRGIMALEMFEHISASDFLKNYSLRGIEPFTMILYDNGELFELKWDFNLKHVRILDPNATHLWASSTLYPEEWQEKRLQWLSDWNEKHPDIDQKAVLDYHHNAGEGNNRYDVKMYVEGIVQTTSITSIEHSAGEMELRFENLVKDSVQRDTVLLQSKI